MTQASGGCDWCADEEACQGKRAPARKESQATLCSIYEAWDAPYRTVPIEECSGAVCAEFVYRYPPGIPILVPGERMTDQVMHLIAQELKSGGSLQGMADRSAKTIRILKGE